MLISLILQMKKGFNFLLQNYFILLPWDSDFEDSVIVWMELRFRATRIWIRKYWYSDISLNMIFYRPISVPASEFYFKAHNNYGGFRLRESGVRCKSILNHIVSKIVSLGMWYKILK